MFDGHICGSALMVYIIAAELFHWEYFKKPVSRTGLGHALSL